MLFTGNCSDNDKAEIAPLSLQLVSCGLKMKSVCQEIARKEVQFSGQSLLVLLQFATICLFGFPLSCDFLISISQHQMTQPPICEQRPE